MVKGEPDFLNYRATPEGFSFVGSYDVPVVEGVQIPLDNIELLGFNYSTKKEYLENGDNKIIHFFLPDMYIERVWDNLENYAAVLNPYRAVVQPDFSQYVGMPRAMLIWQHYRRMWMAAYYQQLGITVIPAPCWSDEESFEYCFDGMPVNSCLCISTVGCMQNAEARVRFNTGLKETIKRLKPSQIIFYGNIDDGIRGMVECPYVQVDSDMKRRIDKHKNSL